MTELGCFGGLVMTELGCFGELVMTELGDVAPF